MWSHWSHISLILNGDWRVASNYSRVFSPQPSAQQKSRFHSQQIEQKVTKHHWFRQKLSNIYIRSPIQYSPIQYINTYFIIFLTTDRLRIGFPSDHSQRVLDKGLHEAKPRNSSERLKNFIRAWNTEFLEKWGTFNHFFDGWWSMVDGWWLMVDGWWLMTMMMMRRRNLSVVTIIILMTNNVLVGKLLRG